MTEDADLLIRRHGPVSIVVLNRPRARNALTVPISAVTSSSPSAPASR